MPDPDEASTAPNSTAEEKFLFAEYAALITIDGSRNERLDRFLTIFMTLAAAPWALYALTLKDHTDMPSFSAMPFPVAVALVLIGTLGGLVVMMFIQMRFTIILYTRVLNAIRGHFLVPGTLAYALPVDSTKPRYYEQKSYILWAIVAMALVNASYIGLGLYNLAHWPHSPTVRLWTFVVLGAAIWAGHVVYYYGEAERRESHSQGAVELKWSK